MPGKCRAGGVRNPKYTGTFVFDNDFAALTPEAEVEAAPSSNTLLKAEPEQRRVPGRLLLAAA